jgi:hypothetical protein
VYELLTSAKLLATFIPRVSRFLHHRSVSFIAQTAASRVNALFENGEILKEGSKDELGELIFDVVAAARGISGLIYTSRAYEPAPFVEEVAEFLRQEGLEFQRRALIRGESGREYRIPLVVKGVYLNPITAEYHRALKPKVDSVVRMWVDIDRKARKFSLLNDIDFVWSEPDVLILSRLSQVYRWSSRQELADELRRAA